MSLDGEKERLHLRHILNTGPTRETEILNARRQDWVPWRVTQRAVIADAWVTRHAAIHERGMAYICRIMIQSILLGVESILEGVVEECLALG